MAAHISVPVFNAAFGGSWTKHLIPLIEPLCTKWKPIAVVYFCGTNDLQVGKSPEEASCNFGKFVSGLPKDTPVVYLTATITPFALAKGEKFVAKCKALKQAVIAAKFPGVEVFDLTSNGFLVDLSLFLWDNHILDDHGHKELARVIAPAVKRAINKV